MKKQITKTNTLERLQRDIARLQKRVRAKVARFEKLVKSGRLVWMSKEEQIVAGDGCWYVKAESFGSGWYYVVLFLEEHGVYQCSCEDVRQATCKHGVALSSHFAEAAEMARVNAFIEKAKATKAAGKPAPYVAPVVVHGGYEYGTAEEIAAVAESQAEAKLATFKAGMDAQYSAAPSKNEKRPPVFASATLEPLPDEDVAAYKARCEAAYQQERRQAAPLNGNRGFSLLR